MKKIALLLVCCFYACYGFSQEYTTVAKLDFDKEKFLQEISENACKCIDSIDTGDNNKKQNAVAINKCIDKQVVAYQLGLKIASLDLDGENKSLNIELSTNANTKEYKQHYYEIERYLSSNCKSVRDKTATMDKKNSNSVSNNSLSLKYYNTGLDEYKKENYEKAIESFKKALAVDKNFAFAYDNIGICYRKLNDFDKAIEYYEKSLKIDPNGQMPLQNIAVAYSYKKEYKKAIKAYEKLAALDNKNPEIYYGIGQVYFQYLNEYEKALDNMCQAYNLYIEMKSPYRSDAEKIIQMIYGKLKEQGKEKVFDEILEKHRISQN